MSDIFTVDVTTACGTAIPSFAKGPINEDQGNGDYRLTTTPPLNTTSMPFPNTINEPTLPVDTQQSGIGEHRVIITSPMDTVSPNDHNRAPEPHPVFVASESSSLLENRVITTSPMDAVWPNDHNRASAPHPAVAASESSSLLKNPFAEQKPQQQLPNEEDEATDDDDFGSPTHAQGPPQSPILHPIDTSILDTDNSLLDIMNHELHQEYEDFSTMDLLDDTPLQHVPPVQALFTAPVADHIHQYSNFLPAESFAVLPPPSVPLPQAPACTRESHAVDEHRTPGVPAPAFLVRPARDTVPVLPKKRLRAPSARKSTKRRKIFNSPPPILMPSISFELPSISFELPPPVLTSAAAPKLVGGCAQPKVKDEYKWIECAFCYKWRKIPECIPNASIPNPFSCIDNTWDTKYNSCGVPQEEVEDENTAIDENPFMNIEQNIHPVDYQYSPYGDPYDAYHNQQPPQKAKRGRKPKQRTPRRTRTGEHVSLAYHLNDTRSVTPEYAQNRREFYLKLERFLGAPPKLTKLCGEVLDLYRLYYECQDKGGFDRVCQQKLWRSIYRCLPNYQETHTSASYAIKKVYIRNLLDYERAHAAI